MRTYIFLFLFFLLLWLLIINSFWPSLSTFESIFSLRFILFVLNCTGSSCSLICGLVFTGLRSLILMSGIFKRLIFDKIWHLKILLFVHLIFLSLFYRRHICRFFCIILNLILAWFKMVNVLFVLRIWYLRVFLGRGVFKR